MYVAHLITPAVTALVGLLLLLPLGQVRVFNGWYTGYLLFSVMVLFTTVYITQRVVERRMVYNHVKLGEDALIGTRAASNPPDSGPVVLQVASCPSSSTCPR